MAVLPTNYLDDILAASMGGKRRFRITHEDGSTEEVTLEDVSEYEQVGSPFGSGDVNKTNQAVNEKLDSADVVDPALATVLGFAADAKKTGDALSELNKNFRNLIIVERKNSEVVEVPAKNPKSIPFINLEKTGYTPIGIVGIAGIEGCFIYNYEVIGNELRSYIYNNTDITKTDSIRYKILYIKN